MSVHMSEQEWDEHNAEYEARIDVLTARYQMALNALREIAAMGKKAGSETARHKLAVLGEPEEAGGYVPGKGFTDGSAGSPVERP